MGNKEITMFKENVDVRIEMMKLGLRNKDLADYLGVSERTVVRWLSKELDSVNREKMYNAMEEYKKKAGLK